VWPRGGQIAFPSLALSDPDEKTPRLGSPMLVCEAPATREDLLNMVGVIQDYEVRHVHCSTAGRVWFNEKEGVFWCNGSSGGYWPTACGFRIFLENVQRVEKEWIATTFKFRCAVEFPPPSKLYEKSIGDGTKALCTRPMKESELAEYYRAAGRWKKLKG